MAAGAVAVPVAEGIGAGAKLVANGARAVAETVSEAFEQAAQRRALYVSQAEELGGLAQRLRGRGWTAEQVVREISPLRNELKLNIRQSDPWFVRKAAEMRNQLKYGDPAGPSPEQLTQKKTWERALEDISKTNPLVNRITDVPPSIRKQ